MDALYSALAALALSSPFLAILLILAYYYTFRAPRWRKHKPATRSAKSAWPTTGVGTALLTLSLIYRPRLEYAIEAQQRQVEDVDEDDNGDPDSPKKHFLRQLRRIRRGEAVETLSVRLE